MPFAPYFERLNQPALLHRRFDESREQRMRIEWLRFELRVELDPDKPRMVGTLNDFRQHAVGRHARKDEAALLQAFAIGAVDFIAVAMPLADVVGTIDARDMAVRREFRFIGAKAHRAAQIGVGAALLQTFVAHPLGDHADNGFIGRTELGARRVSDTAVPRPLDARHLHAEADAEEGHPAFAREAHARNLALGPALTEAAGDENAVHRLEIGGEILVALEHFGVEPADIDLDPVRHAAVDQRLVQRFIGIGQRHIFADDANRDLALGMLLAVHDVVPARQVGRGRVVDAERAQYLAIEPFAMILDRDRIDAVGVERGDHRFLADVAKQRDLGALRLGQRLFTTAEQDIRLNAQRREFAHAVLRRLGLQLARGGDIRHQRDMDRDRVFTPLFVLELTDRLDEGQRFDVADGAPDFAQHEVEVVGFGAGELLDRVGDLRDDLHRRAEVVAAAFLADDASIDAARGVFVPLPSRNSSYAFIMASFEIGPHQL